ncbi:MAG: hypothetical protein LLG97_15020, partial [Deltaproteobacteria bacterium]|nr:hypothetical protein [Deltaproteobacteria bacterium]
STVISTSSFFDNKVPLGINVNFSMDDTNAFTSGAAAPMPNRYQGIQVAGCGHVKSAVTWSATRVPFIIGDPTSCNYLAIDGGASLTLGANVVLKFFPSGVITVDGTLTANTDAFTSIKDDAHGGDTNGDGAATAPAAGDWGRINIRANGSSFDRCSFLYGGGDNTPVLDIGTTSASITRSVFAHNGDQDTITAYPALDAREALTGTVITGNSFFDNKVPLRISANFSMGDSNTFDSGVVLAPMPNRYQGIQVAGCGHVKSAVTWSATRVPFIIGDPTSCSYVAIDGGASLTLGPNVVLKFVPSGGITVNAGGNINANATATAPIVFTSVKDDAHGGDTNGDGAASAPTAGDWGGINLNAGGSTFGYCMFLYGGYNNTPALFVNGVSASVTHTIFAHNGDLDAITADPALDARTALSSTVISTSSFFDNKVPLGINVNFSMDDSNVFSSGAAAPMPNRYQGIQVAGCGHFKSAVTWSATRVPFIIGDPTSCKYLIIDGGASLTLADNVVLKFQASGGSLGISSGGALLHSHGAGTAGVVFTSIRDDARGGDTNGDGSATTPAAGEWEGIYGPGSDYYTGWGNIYYSARSN